MRDPVLYRIRRAHHHRTGDAWCIYPMYDYAHPISDALEGITHSICTLEFEDHRPLYDWLIANLPLQSRPQQIEFARLNLTFTVMGKPQRAAEPSAQERYFRSAGVPVVGSIQPPGLLEGGDFVWLDNRTAAVGLGYRTNGAGVRQLRDLLGDSIDELVEVALPHWRGPGDVFHLMSIVSPVDRDLAVVYSPLMPVSFRLHLLERGTSLIEVPDDEFVTMGANVLALEPGKALMIAGNPKTRARLEAAGVEVIEYAGSEISLKGGGGPTCLTRPLSRRHAGVSPRLSPEAGDPTP